MTRHAKELKTLDNDSELNTEVKVTEDCAQVISKLDVVLH